MQKIRSFVKLDFVTIKPYMTLKNLLIFLICGLILGYSTGNAGSIVGFILALALLYAIYPFAVGEQSGIDALYSTLSISRKDVVLGRYVFAMMLDLFCGFLAFVIVLVTLAIQGKPIVVVETVISVIVILGVFSLIQLVQFPLFFKLGYAKAKLASFIMFAGIPFGIVIFGVIYDRLGVTNMWNHAVILGIICFIAWLICCYVSYRVSVKFYKKRDF